MNIFFSTIIIVLLLHLSITNLYSKPYVMHSENIEGQSIFKYLRCYEDTTSTLTINDIFKQDNFKNFDVTVFSKSRFWFKFEILNNTNFTNQMVVVCRSPSIDYIDFYYLNINKIMEVYHTGDRLRFSERPIYDNNFCFPVNVYPGLNTYYISCKSSGPIRLPLYLYSQKNFRKNQSDYDFLFGMFCGFALMICFCYLFFLLYFRKLVILSSFFTMLIALYNAIQINGLSFKYFFQNYPVLDDYSALASLTLSCFFCLVTVDCFDNKHTKIYLYYKIFIKFSQICSIALTIFLLFGDFNTCRSIVYIFFCLSYFIGFIFYIYIFGFDKTYTMATIGYIIVLFAIWGETIIYNYIVKNMNDMIVLTIATSGLTCVAFIFWGIGVINIAINKLKIRQDAEDELFKTLQKNNHLETEFINTLSHELATPLQASLYAIDSLKKYTQPKIETYLNRLELAINRMTLLINNFLEKVHTHPGKVELFKKRENIIYIINNLLKELEVFSLQANHTIIFEQKYSNEDFSIFIDKNCFEQALSNIIINAIKYTPVNGTILILIKKTQTEYVISIADNGYGIDVNNSNDIFKSIYRSEFLKSASGGMGIGLSITRKIINAHGGSLTFISPLTSSYSDKLELNNIRKGTVFYIKIPIISY